MKKVRTSDLELKDRLVSIQRVTKVTKGGRTFSFSAIVVVGNENGVVGYGLGKASEVTSAIAKGVTYCFSGFRRKTRTGAVSISGGREFGRLAWTVTGGFAGSSLREEIGRAHV